MKIGNLPRHLILFYLWRAARPDTAVINHDPRPIRCGADVKWYLDQAKSPRPSFVWLDGRPLFLTFTGRSVTTRGYDEKNGLGAAEKALSLLQQALRWFEQELGSREAAVKHLTDTPPVHLDIDVTREFGPGRALFDAIFS